MRAKFLQEQDNAEHCRRVKLIVHPASTTSLKEELLKLERATRGSDPACLHFGIDTDAHQVPYPNYLFCSNSDKWVDDCNIFCENRKKMSRNSKAYKSKAQGTLFISPTTKIKQHWPLNMLDFNKELHVTQMRAKQSVKMPYAPVTSNGSNQTTKN
jgi:hypothetical protein